MENVPPDHARELLSRSEELLVSIKLGRLVTANHVLQVAEKRGYVTEICTATGADRQKWLLAVRHDPDYPLLLTIGKEKRAPVIEAIKLAREDFVVKMIEYGLDANVSVNRKSMTLLGACVHFAQGNILRRLVDHGANVNLQNSLWQSPIYNALEEGNLDALQYLLERGANANNVDSFGQTPLIYFLSSKHLRRTDIKCVEALLRHNADPNMKDLQSKRAALHEILSNSHVAGEVKVDIIELLLERRAEPDILDVANSSPLHYVCSKGPTERCAPYMTPQERCRVVALLLKYGANPNIHDDHYNTPLHEAAQADLAKVAEILVENGADPEKRNIEGFRPMALAKAGMGVENILSEAMEKSKENKENQARARDSISKEPAGNQTCAGITFGSLSGRVDGSVTRLRTCVDRLEDAICHTADLDDMIKDQDESFHNCSDEIDGALPPSNPGPDVDVLKTEFFKLKSALFGVINDMQLIKDQLKTHKDCRAIIDVNALTDVTEDHVDAKPGTPPMTRQPSPRPGDDHLLIQACHVTSTIIGYDWKSLFRELEADDLLQTEVVIKELEGQYIGQLREQAYQALIYWKHRKGSLATIQTLCQAVEACGLCAVRERLEEKCQLEPRKE